MGKVAEEMRVSDARANITDVISHVRLLRWTILLTNRDRPVATVTSVRIGKLIRRAGGEEAAAQVLADHLGIDLAEVDDRDPE